MKAEILKIAGVKSEKEFYKKYPTEEAFMKAHGKAFKKAERGMKIAQNGIRQPVQPVNELQSYGIDNSSNTLPRQQVQPVNQVQPYSIAPQPGTASQFEYGQLQPLPETPKSEGLDKKIGEKQPGIMGSLVKGRSAIRAQRRERKKTEQARALSDLTLRASQTRPEQIERDYVRPEDIMMSGEELAPIYGTGTNVLAKNGAEIRSKTSPKRLYNDLGYTPITKAHMNKLYYSGGDIPKFQAGGGAGGGGGASGGGMGGFMNMFKGMFGGGGGKSGGGATTGQGGSGEKGSGFQNFMDGGGGNQVAQIGEGLGDAAAGTSSGQRSAGAQVGGDVGGEIGSIWGPVGQMVGQFAGNIIGGALDGNPRKMKKNRQATKANMQRAAFNYGLGSVQQLHSGYMQNGGEIPMLERNGELQTMWGGDVENISDNHHLGGGSGETVLFKGNSHTKSDGKGNKGIGIMYGNSPVEVEGGEPATEIDDELVVYGNLKIPNDLVSLLGDKDAKGKKFKNYAKGLSKKEEKENNKLDKAMKQLSELDVNTSFDKLKLSSLEANVKGSDMKLKELADKKRKAADLQSAINATAEEMNVDVDALSKGKIKKAKKGTYMPKAQDGRRVTPSPFYDDLYDPDRVTVRHSRGSDSLYGDDINVSGFDDRPVYNPPMALPDETPTRMSAFDRRPVTTPPSAIPEPTAKRAVPPRNTIWTGAGDPPMALPDETPLRAVPQVGTIELDDQGSPTGGGNKPNPFKGKREEVQRQIEQEREEIRKLETKIFNSKDEEEKVSDIEEVEYKKSKLAQLLNEVLPYLRPSNKEGLDANQLMGEMLALNTNQLEPVQAQTFQPDLSTPFEISLQDIRNENQADFRSMQRMTGGNPAAQSLLAGQKYKANQSVGAEEFRINQANKDKVYGENRQLINQSKLTNLGILDKQYERQAAAKSKTKATTQQAINSIAGKYLQNDLENKRLGILENMYNYRFDANGRAINMNTPAEFHIPVLDENGNVVAYKENPNATQAPDAATPPINPEQGKYGKRIKSNGGIVKALKNI